MFQDFIHLLFPKICACCDHVLQNEEECFCTLCRSELPVTKHHLIEENETKKVFYGRIPIEKAFSLLYYEKGGIVQNLIHDLKYRGNQKISEVLGKWQGKLFVEVGLKNQFDCVIPVPIHQQRLRKRGYNQVDKYAEALASLLDITCKKEILLRKNTRRTQVFKNRVARTKVSQNDFYLAHEKAKENLRHKHILLVDDIITTGATIEACVQQLLQIADVKISIASMALAR